MKWSGSLVVLAAILLLVVVLEADARGRCRAAMPIRPLFPLNWMRERDYWERDYWGRNYWDLREREDTRGCT